MSASKMQVSATFEVDTVILYSTTHPLFFEVESCSVLKAVVCNSLCTCEKSLFI